VEKLKGFFVINMKKIIKLDPKISPLYQAIRTIDKQAIPSGAGDANYIEPLVEYIIIEFHKIRKIFQGLEEEVLY